MSLKGKMRYFMTCPAHTRDNLLGGAVPSSNKEFLQLLNIVGGSLSRLDAPVKRLLFLCFLTPEQREPLDSMISSMNKKRAGLIRHKKRKVQ